ncbi:leucine-rich repeat-containing protein 51-like [Diaphorina citri]|uniref:Leucine-rich repeat-containing protein 51 n=1 Tax=Diaphorina citri TaxID=121845 RepID=A0A1S3DBK7_DIACI|nr:leucine-rich repeat-containing protein 51-like [Diaphorina citri]KAI5703231.1 hypothetical protein M8J75_009306 [Diaphorina citri]KAI5733684.1 hypothetical protein M8J76_014705 [Diaphorina citri]
MSEYYKTPIDPEFKIPLDLSFQQIQSLDKVAVQKLKPNVHRLGESPPMLVGRYDTRSLWLSHNKISLVYGLDSLVHRTILDPDLIGWIDLSFNNIKNVDKNMFTNFPNLKILYLHKNQIEEYLSVFVLRRVNSLRTLSLYGNPIEKIREYRAVVSTMIPQLVTLDSVFILPSEKQETNALNAEIRSYLLPKYEKLEAATFKRTAVSVESE